MAKRVTKSVASHDVLSPTIHTSHDIKHYVTWISISDSACEVATPPPLNEFANNCAKGENT